MARENNILPENFLHKLAILVKRLQQFKNYLGCQTPVVLSLFCQKICQVIRQKFLRLWDQSSPNAFCSSVMDSMEIGQARSPVFLGSSSTPVDFQVQATRNLRRSDYVKAKGYISPEHGQTVDLVQLSSHLQRVEQQRNSMQLKQANENFCYFPTI